MLWVVGGLPFVTHYPAQISYLTVINNEVYNELNFEIYKALTKLETLVLNLFLQGLSYLEIAKKLNCTENSVDGALTRARTKIKKVYSKIKNNIGE